MTSQKSVSVEVVLLVYTTSYTSFVACRAEEKLYRQSEPQSTQSAGPVRFLIFSAISITLLASLVAGRRPQYTAGAD
jgi:hypothetical protein